MTQASPNPPRPDALSRTAHDSAMSAPTTRIQTLVIVRPVKAIAIVLSAVALLLMSLTVAATTWLEANSTREGLWEKCYYLVNTSDLVHCDLTPTRDWLQICRGLWITAMVLCLAGLVLTSAGLRSKNVQMRPRCYTAGMVIWFMCVGVELTSLLTFPIKFLEEMSERSDEVHWHFGWGYGVGWASALIIFASGLLLIVDKDAEEVVYREITLKKQELGTDEATEAV